MSSNNNSTLQLTVEKLDGKNFREWAQSIKLVIDGKGKLGYLTGETKEPPSTDPTQGKKWKSENSMVMAWLVNSMQPAIGKTYLFLPTAKDVWDAVRETYSDMENSAQIFEIQTRLWQMKQGEREVTEYYIEMKSLWQELDLSFGETWECSGDSVKYKKRLEDERVFEFLAGLNRVLDDVRGRILGRKPLPSTREVFAEVRREELRRKVMMDDSGGPESSALIMKKPGIGPASTGPPYSNGPSNVNGPFSSWAKANNGLNQGQQRKRPWCDHCHKPGHKIDGCWDLHGKPPDWKPKQNRNRAYQATVNDQSSTPFSKDQMDQLYKMLSNFQTSSQPSEGLPSGSLVHKGNFSKALNTISQTKNPWIVDSGASDHMTGNSHIFSTYSPSAGNLKVQIADGSLSSVAGKGTIQLSDSVTLRPTLHVPNLSCNLLSISQLTNNSNCSAHFYPTYCVFQDLSSGKTIGSAKEYEGLYYLDQVISNRQPQTAMCDSAPTSRENEIMLWHFRHFSPSFQY